MLVMLKTPWPNSFRRTIRNKKGDVVKVLSFDPGKPVEVSDKEAGVLKGDIGNCLLVGDYDDKGKFRAFDSELQEVARQTETLVEAA